MFFLVQCPLGMQQCIYGNDLVRNIHALQISNCVLATSSTCIVIRLKADRPHLHDYPQTSTNYRGTDWRSDRCYQVPSLRFAVHKKHLDPKNLNTCIVALQKRPTTSIKVCLSFSFLCV